MQSMKWQHDVVEGLEHFTQWTGSGENNVMENIRSKDVSQDANTWMETDDSKHSSALLTFCLKDKKVNVLELP